ncbi:uncharacterized protein METZ01_LOCUS454108, partial [marine metagenome]
RAGRLRAGRRLHTRYGRRPTRRPAHADNSGLLDGGGHTAARGSTANQRGGTV